MASRLRDITTSLIPKFTSVSYSNSSIELRTAIRNYKESSKKRKFLSVGHPQGNGAICNVPRRTRACELASCFLRHSLTQVLYEISFIGRYADKKTFLRRCNGLGIFNFQFECNGCLCLREKVMLRNGASVASSSPSSGFERVK